MLPLLIHLPNRDLTEKKKRTNLDINLRANKDTRVALSVLTAADRLHGKYTCNVCSALLNIRPVNVADMAYHYFLFSSPPHSLSACLQPPPPHPDCHQPLSASTTSHLLTSSVEDEQAEEQTVGKRAEP